MAKSETAVADYDPGHSLFDPGNPFSLLNTAPETVVPVIKRVMEKYPATMLKPDIVLRVKCKPDQRDHRLRLSFWDEYNAATALGKRMCLRNVIHKICPIEVWNGYYARNLLKTLWIITAPRDYVLEMRHIHAQGLERLEQIMKLPITNKKGETDHKAVALILKTFQLVDLRMKGSILQKVRIQKQSLNVDVNAEQMQQLSQMSIEELDALDRKLEKMQKIENKVYDAQRTIEAEDPVKTLDLKGIAAIEDEATLKEFKDDDLTLLDRR